MLYSVATYRLHPHEAWQEDLFCQALADQGFEVFETSEDGTEMRAYIPTELGNRLSVIESHDWAEPVSFEVCPDDNWNAEWEKENAEKYYSLPNGRQLVIHPHCAFGAGHHETTSMILERLMTLPPAEKTVLDNGCGTGILGIACAMMGAQKVVATDIDDKAVSNTRENAELNGVEERLDIRQGDTPPEGTYDLILSNIHRNILIAQMPLYARYVREGGEVWLSGFLREDARLIRQAAEQEGLQLKDEQEKNTWILSVLYRPHKAPEA